ncbi:hypothetical protein H4J02_12950 [Protaetiibacter sp. SSC-01]|uniref:pilus assembly protein TadG-related protein n=1 Tax=Protaetiibacter sp. SSC-01 TaxID=2759943 RepID=UPI00165716B1|nr:pilus assembly protein TadG-related protein [Protaetiibacter sp. SSC-01]QNO37325.1 hypothetical protein H4J02_12950 [Protaetiibacter sp. SSC-01]
MPLASASGLPVALVVAVLLIALVIVAGVVLSRTRRNQAAADAAAAAAPAPEPEPEQPSAPAASVDGTPVRPDPHAPGTIWGLHVPGAPVQRMAKSLAVGFALIDPEETSRVVHSADDGANWWVLPRDRWGEDV